MHAKRDAAAAAFQLAARSAILVAVSPVLFVASGIHGDKLGVAVALLLAAMYLLVDRDAPLVAGIALAIASRVEPMALLAAPVALTAVASGAGAGEDEGRPARRSRLVHFGGALAGALAAAWVPSLAWGWDSLKGDPGGGSAPGGLGPGWVLARSVDQGLAGWLLGPGRPLVLAVAVVPAVIWVRRRPRRVYAAVGLLLLAPWPWPRPGRRGTWSGRPCSATWGTPAGPASTPSPPGPASAGPPPGGAPASPGPPGSPPAPSPTAPSPASAWSRGWCWGRGCSWDGGRWRWRRGLWERGLWTTRRPVPAAGLPSRLGPPVPVGRGQARPGPLGPGPVRPAAARWPGTATCLPPAGL